MPTTNLQRIDREENLTGLLTEELRASIKEISQENIPISIVYNPVQFQQPSSNKYFGFITEMEVGVFPLGVQASLDTWQCYRGRFKLYICRQIPQNDRKGLINSGQIDILNKLQRKYANQVFLQSRENRYRNIRIGIIGSSDPHALIPYNISSYTTIEIDMHLTYEFKHEFKIYESEIKEVCLLIEYGNITKSIIIRAGEIIMPIEITDQNISLYAPRALYVPNGVPLPTQLKDKEDNTFLIPPGSVAFTTNDDLRREIYIREATLDANGEILGGTWNQITGLIITSSGIVSGADNKQLSDFQHVPIGTMIWLIDEETPERIRFFLRQSISTNANEDYGFKQTLFNGEKTDSDLRDFILQTIIDANFGRTIKAETLPEATADTEEDFPIGSNILVYDDSSSIATLYYRDSTDRIIQVGTSSSEGGGTIGDKGPRGDKGPVGDQGPVGEQGPVGIRGADGNAGADGNPGVVGNKGPVGDKGPTGDKGEDGGAGEGSVPTGGTTGQQLVKSSNTNFATEWQTQPTLPIGLPSGGSIGQIIFNTGSGRGSWGDVPDGTGGTTPPPVVITNAVVVWTKAFSSGPSQTAITTQINAGKVYNDLPIRADLTQTPARYIFIASKVEYTNIQIIFLTDDGDVNSVPVSGLGNRISDLVSSTRVGDYDVSYFDLQSDLTQRDLNPRTQNNRVIITII